MHLGRDPITTSLIIRDYVGTATCRRAVRCRSGEDLSSDMRRDFCHRRRTEELPWHDRPAYLHHRHAVSYPCVSLVWSQADSWSDLRAIPSTIQAKRSAKHAGSVRYPKVEVTDTRTGAAINAVGRQVTLLTRWQFLSFAGQPIVAHRGSRQPLRVHADHGQAVER